MVFLSSKFSGNSLFFFVNRRSSFLFSVLNQTLKSIHTERAAQKSATDDRLCRISCIYFWFELLEQQNKEKKHNISIKLNLKSKKKKNKNVQQRNLCVRFNKAEKNDYWTAFRNWKKNEEK